jgi:ELWxxDGT repeat protein
MRKEAIAPLLVLLMLVAAGGYMLMNNDGTGSETPDVNDKIGEWDVYYVDSGSDLPACGSATLGRLYYVADTAGFETCTSAGWAFVDLTGPAGPAGADGAQGPAGADGAQGPAGADGADGANGTDGDGDDGAQGAAGVNGTDGQDGANGQDGEDGEQGDQGMIGMAGYDGADGMDGLSAMAVTSTESPGTNCTDGGIKIEVGLDDNNDGSLQASEVDQTQYVCNGGDGQDGQDGADGSASQNTMLTSISAPTLQACSSGGRIVEQGLDNGDGGGTAQNGVLESGEVDYTTTYCSNFVVARMADISSGGSSNPGRYADFTVMGTRLYFDADDGSSGRELWAHETTNSSTWLVADIDNGWGGSSGSEPGYDAGLTVVGTRLYFDAYDGSSGGTGTELWAHETTNSSTWLVVDINSGGSSYPGLYAGITVVGTRLYFDANDASSGNELWAHETTNSSTWQVAVIVSGFGSSNPGGNAGITVVGTRLYFDAYDGSSGGTGTELWAHETTNSSTWQVAVIVSGFGSSNPGGNAGITVVGTRLYFDAYDGSSSRELWAHETTNSSTWLVADINSGGGGSNPGRYAGLTVVDTRLYFDANDGSSGYELWRMEIEHSITYN